MSGLHSGSEAADFDVAIVGAGVAGVAAAAGLVKDGRSVALIDYRDRVPPQFRAEKIGPVEVLGLESVGLGVAARRQLTMFEGVWVHRFGRLVSRSSSPEYSSPYADLVNALSDGLPTTVARIHGRVDDVQASAGNQLVRLGDGRTVTARLVVLATGQGDGVRNRLGISNDTLSKGHSLAIGFDLANAKSEFAFPSLVWLVDAPAAKTAYVSLFPMGEIMRANAFTYRDANDPWIARLRAEPDAAIAELFPALMRTYGALRVADRVQMRPLDLTQIRGYHRPGVVAIGDAFFVTCPATGTGITKALNDVAVLRRKLPQWLATPGMATEKVASFYDDPAKLTLDRASLTLALKERAVRLDHNAGAAMLRMRRNVLRRGVYVLRDLLHMDGGKPASTRRA